MNSDFSSTTIYSQVIMHMKTMNMNHTIITCQFIRKPLIFQSRNKESQNGARQMNLAFDLRDEK